MEKYAKVENFMQMLLRITYAHYNLFVRKASLELRCYKVKLN